MIELLAVTVLVFLGLYAIGGLAAWLLDWLIKLSAKWIIR